jgi:hypothetical protein
MMGTGKVKDRSKPKIEVTFGDTLIKSKEAMVGSSSPAEAEASEPVPASDSTSWGMEKIKTVELDESFVGRGRSVSHTWDPETEVSSRALAREQRHADSDRLVLIAALLVSWLCSKSS